MRCISVLLHWYINFVTLNKIMKLNKMAISKSSAEPQHQLFEAIAAISTSEEARKFFQDLCTPAEIQAMADRWRVVDLIKKGKPYRQIYDETGVSVTTIGRVARCMMLGEDGYNIIYKRLEEKKHGKKIKKSKD